jgi:hypothetical protein
MNDAFDLAHALGALHACDPSCTRDVWVRLAMAAKAAGIDFEAFARWSSGSANYCERDCMSLWRSIRRGDGIGPGSLFRCALDAGWQPPLAGNSIRRTRADRLTHARKVEAAAREREQQQRAEWAANAKRNAQLSAQLEPVREGDPVYRYLCRRLAIDAFAALPCLRLHPALDYWHEGERLGTFPAMVAQVTAPDGRLLALHRTYLTADGHKADVPTVKKLTSACGPLAGASIRLQQPQRGVIGVAEGIETALAASLASGVPTVAAYCASALAGFLWPARMQRLVIFADADRAGREAADTLRARALRADLRVNVMSPSDEGSDWADVWQQRGAVTIDARGFA